MADLAAEGTATVTPLRHPRWQVERRVSGRLCANTQRYHLTEKGAATRRRAREKENLSPRKRARDLCRKRYGVSLSFYDNLGWYPPDIREALNGHS